MCVEERIPHQTTPPSPASRGWGKMGMSGYGAATHMSPRWGYFSDSLFILASSAQRDVPGRIKFLFSVTK